jgi:hypothetical protein
MGKTYRFGAFLPLTVELPRFQDERGGSPSFCFTAECFVGLDSIKSGWRMKLEEGSGASYWPVLFYLSVSACFLPDFVPLPRS